MRIVFMGTPDFAVPSLIALASRHEIHLVLTQPDRPAGRGRKLIPPPIKVEAQSLNLRVIQPERANHPDVLALIQEMRPQVIAVVAYGCILKKPLLETPSIAPVNLHASLLPKYRGVTPINRAIMEGESVTGVTTIHMDEGIDTGNILLQDEIEIGEGETAGELSDRLADTGARLLLRTVDELEAGRLKEIPQDDSKATYARKMKKGDGAIPWESEAFRVVNHIRGVTPWPGAISHLQDSSLTVLEAVIVGGGRGAGASEEAGSTGAARAAGEADTTGSGKATGADEASGTANTVETKSAGSSTASGGAGGAPEPGTVISLSSEGPVVATGEGAVVLRRVCPAGKKPMDGAAWARGKRDLVGCRFSGQS
jgi:methionyl-tRNA formyltransferase